MRTGRPSSRGTAARAVLVPPRWRRGFHQARLRRYNFETQWQESALLAWPEMANTFFYGYDQMPGQKKTLQQIDSSASIARRTSSVASVQISTSFWRRSPSVMIPR